MSTFDEVYGYNCDDMSVTRLSIESSKILTKFITLSNNSHDGRYLGICRSSNGYELSVTKNGKPAAFTFSNSTNKLGHKTTLVVHGSGPFTLKLRYPRTISSATDIILSAIRTFCQ